MENKRWLDFQPSIFALLARELNTLLDEGKSIPVEEIMMMCNNNTVIEWLAKNTPHSMAMWDEETKTIMSVEFESFANCILPEELGVTNNGIALLLSFCLEFIMTPPTRTIQDCI